VGGEVKINEQQLLKRSIVGVYIWSVMGQYTLCVCVYGVSVYMGVLCVCVYGT